MTSYGNSLNNIWLTETAYRMINIDKKLVIALILGDDNLSIFRGKAPEGLQDKLQAIFKKLGFTAKVKVTNHIAKAEFCNMWFVPTKT